MNVIKLYIKPMKAFPKPPLSSVLGQNKININTFCNEFNSKTKLLNKNLYYRVFINILRSGFKFTIKPPTISVLVSYAIKIFDLSKKKKCLYNNKLLNYIYDIKKLDFNTLDKNKCFKIIKGTLKSFNL